MGKSREIKGRIKAVKNIQRITRTMQMIATSKFSKAQQLAVAGQPYSEGLFELVARLAQAAGGDELSHPLLTEPDAGGDPKEVTLVITSDRGLAGPYNANVLRVAMRHLREHEAAKAGVVELVGKKGVAALTFAGVDIDVQHTQFGDQPAYEDVEALAQAYMDRFAAGEISGVRVVYMKYFSAGRQKPEVMQLLPLSQDAIAADEGDDAAEETAATKGDVAFEFSPSPAELLDTLLPAAVKSKLFQAFNDAVVSEHVARMVAMKAATDNAGKMRKSLSRRYNRARQAQITTELTEIISGAAALG